MYNSIVLFPRIYKYNLKQTQPYIIHKRWTLRQSFVYIFIRLNCIFNLPHTIKDNYKDYNKLVSILFLLH